VYLFKYRELQRLHKNEANDNDNQLYKNINFRMILDKAYN